MSSELSKDATYFLVAMSVDRIALAEIIEWADREIENSVLASEKLIELSLSKNRNEIYKIVESLSEQRHREWAGRRLLSKVMGEFRDRKLSALEAGCLAQRVVAAAEMDEHIAYEIENLCDVFEQVQVKDSELFAKCETELMQILDRVSTGKMIE